MKNSDWVKKLELEVIEDGDDMVLSFSWDEKDPELQFWTELGEENRTKFVLNALRQSCGLTPEENLG